MRLFTALVEALEARPDDVDRVAALARHLRAVGRDAGALAGAWLVVGARPRRPARLTQRALAEAAARIAAAAGTARWLFEVGVDASAETAEAIALLLPWPEPASPSSSDPTLADWLAAWHAAAASPPAQRTDAIVATIAALDDAITRRWAVRAACGLARPLVDAWQWQRAWALAFDEDAHALAWTWHRDATFERAAATASFGLRPRPFVSLPEAADDAHAELLAAWRRDAAWAEPRWRGERVQVVRHGADVALWRRDGSLANAALPPAWLASDDWPDPCVIDAVLVTRTATLHLVLVDWQRWRDDEGVALSTTERRARLRSRWPEVEVATWADDVDIDGGAGRAPPRVFTTPIVAPHDHADADALAMIAARGRDAGWSGVVLRSRDAPLAWSVRAPEHRVQAVLQYVPTDALASAAGLAFADCGFALWSRAPRSEREQFDAMAASMAGEFLPEPAPGVPALRLLPLARVPVALPDDELHAIHAWLRAHLGQRFGGMHAVAPALVFELGFARVRASRRHKIGWVLERPRLLRWLQDAPSGAAQRVEDLAALVHTAKGIDGA